MNDDPKVPERIWYDGHTQHMRELRHQPPEEGSVHPTIGYVREDIYKGLAREKREAALDALAAAGQAQEAYEAQLKAEAKLAKAEKIADEVFDFFEAKGATAEAFGAAEVGARIRAVLAEIEGGADV
jgi:hypothetical protein